MIVFSRGRAAPDVAKAAAIRRTAIIGYYRKFEAENKRAPQGREVAKALGYTNEQVHSAYAWMRLHGLIKAVAK